MFNVCGEGRYEAPHDWKGLEATLNAHDQYTTGPTAWQSQWDEASQSFHDVEVRLSSLYRKPSDGYSRMDTFWSALSLDNQTPKNDFPPTTMSYTPYQMSYTPTAMSYTSTPMSHTPTPMSCIPTGRDRSSDKTVWRAKDDSLANPASHASFSMRDTEIFEIPGIIASHTEANALGDLCAKRNFMKAAFAERLGLVVDRKETSTIIIGSGKRISTIGTLKTLFQFKREPMEYPVVFHILPNCVHDVILGNKFLRATQTFSSLINHGRRVVKKVIQGFIERHFLYLGDSSPRFSGILNGQKQEALADTGSKILIMDESFARSAHIPIVEDHSRRIQIRFADGTAAMTTGMSYAVSWEFGPGRIGEEHLLDFHILRNAPAAVILSDQFIFATNALAEFDCYFVDDDEDDDDACFFAIDVDRNYGTQDHDHHFKDMSLHMELIRRGEEDDRISDLPLVKQAEARTAETQRRVLWDAQQRISERASTNPVVSIAIGTPHSSTGASSTPIPPRKSRWRFKLKRRKEP